MHRASLLTAVAVFTGCFVGCAFGPKMLERSHGQYASVVQQVDEEQLLTTIVRMRYMESPQSLAVTAIAAQYELGVSAEARPFYGTEASNDIFRSFSTVLPFFGVNGANRPTISLAPSDDSSTVRQFLTPISIDSMVFLSQSGWPISNILKIWVERINGVPNLAPGNGSLRNIHSDYHRFQRVCELMQFAQDHELLSLHAEDRPIQVSGPLPADAVTSSALVEAAKNGFEYEFDQQTKQWHLVKHHPALVLMVNTVGHDSPVIDELFQILHLEPGHDRYRVIVASGIPDPALDIRAPATSLILTPRSSAQALFYLSHGVDVPPAHLECGLVRSMQGVNSVAATRGVFHVYSSPGKPHERPACAYRAIRYRDHWYYIHDSDVESKGTLLLMLQLRRLDFRRQQIGNVPALTLQVGR